MWESVGSEVTCLSPDSAGVEEYLDTIYLQMEVKFYLESNAHSRVL